MNINTLDLEEQEQLEKVKEFWRKFGTLITAVLVIGSLAFAGMRGWEWYQSNQALKAAALYEQVNKDAAAGDLAKLDTSLKLMQDSYGSTTYAQQAGLLAAQTYADKQQWDKAQAALQAVAAQKTDVGLQSIAKLNLASIQMEQKQYDQALQTLNGNIDAAFTPLVNDRKGDVLSLQSKNAEAIASYTDAYKAMDKAEPYRAMVGMKLTALGVDVEKLVPAEPAMQAASGAASAASAAVAAAPTASTAAAPASAASAQ